MTDSITSSTAAVAATATSSGSAAGESAITDAALADYDDFLTLLTTQLKNQDPLNPQDSTEFVEQIATFTGVEQQINANERLDELIAATVAQDVADLAGWVGMEVSAPGLAYSFDGTELTFDPLVDATAQSAKALIKDETGEILAEIDYAPGDDSPLSWDGSTTSGGSAGAGSYFIDFEVTSLDEAGEPQTQTFSGSDFSEVVEARLIDGQPSLILSNGYVVPSEQVTAVRSALAAVN